MSEVTVLYEGYSTMTGKDQMSANCSCTLIMGSHNVIVDTMTAWDSEKILTALHKHNLSPEQINYVVSTHGHSDHIGNNNLFLNAKHIVGFSVSFKEKYYMHPFDKGEEYCINNSVKVIPTPGHTLSDVTVLVTTAEGQRIALSGLLTERNVYGNMSASAPPPPSVCRQLKRWVVNPQSHVYVSLLAYGPPEVLAQPPHPPLSLTLTIGDLFENCEDIENPNVWLEAGSDDPVQQMKNRLKVAEVADWIVPGHGPKFYVSEHIRNSLRRQAGNAPV